VQGEQNPQARALLASLMSLASVESPVLMQSQSGGLYPISSEGEGVGEQALPGVESKTSLPSSAHASFAEGAFHSLTLV